MTTPSDRPAPQVPAGPVDGSVDAGRLMEEIKARVRERRASGFYSEDEVRRITDECYAEARRLLRDNRGKLDAIVAQLLARESLDEPEVYAAAGIERLPGQPPAKPATPAVVHA